MQEPHPPILIGGGGEKRTLRIVAKYADMCNVSGSPEEVKHKFGLLDQHCAGRRPRPEEHPPHDPGAAVPERQPGVQAARAAGHGRRDRTPAGRGRKSILLGNVDEVKEQVAGFRDAGVEEMYLALWPRFIMPSREAFSEEVIPAFA